MSELWTTVEAGKKGRGGRTTQKPSSQTNPAPVLPKAARTSAQKPGQASTKPVQKPVQSDISSVVDKLSGISITEAEDRYVALDVECVIGADDKKLICSVAVVDAEKRVLLNKLVRPSGPVTDYVTHITGFTEESLRGGESEAAVLTAVHRLLSPEVILVGQSISNDILWLQLVEGVHYKSVVDLAVLLRKPNHTFSFSLEHKVRALLMTGEERRRQAPNSKPHTALSDALNSMELYLRFGEGRCSKGVRWNAIQQLYTAQREAAAAKKKKGP